MKTKFKLPLILVILLPLQSCGTIGNLANVQPECRIDPNSMDCKQAIQRTHDDLESQRQSEENARRAAQDREIQANNARELEREIRCQPIWDEWQACASRVEASGEGDPSLSPAGRVAEVCGQYPICY